LGVYKIIERFFTRVFACKTPRTPRGEIRGTAIQEAAFVESSSPLTRTKKRRPSRKVRSSFFIK